MSRSWFFFGLLAVTTAAGFAGCTITTDTNGNEGGAGGDGGYAGGGAGGDGGYAGGGTGGDGGVSNVGGGGSDQGGTSSTGGSSQGGSSSQGSFSDAVSKACAIKEVWSCLGDSESECPPYYNLANKQFRQCESLYTKYLECVLKAPTSDLVCESKALVVSSCKTEDDAWFDCTL
jgi:hypothetical protein